MKSFMLAVAAALTVTVAGCSNYEPAPVAERSPEGSPAQIRKDLQPIAESGTGDSALQPIVMGMKSLEPGFPKAKELQAAYEKLLAAGTPEQRQQIATEMIGIIDSVQPPQGEKP